MVLINILPPIPLVFMLLPVVFPLLMQCEGQPLCGSIWLSGHWVSFLVIWYLLGSLGQAAPICSLVFWQVCQVLRLCSLLVPVNLCSQPLCCYCRSCTDAYIVVQGCQEPLGTFSLLLLLLSSADYWE